MQSHMGKASIRCDFLEAMKRGMIPALSPQAVTAPHPSAPSLPFNSGPILSPSTAIIVMLVLRNQCSTIIWQHKAVKYSRSCQK